MQESQLIQLARESIGEHFFKDRLVDLVPYKPSFSSKQGVFVTLMLEGTLRGCIGDVIGSRPLYQGVYELAKKAAFQDPRFPPLTKGEYDMITLELSLLSIPVEVQSEKDIEVGKHGVILHKGDHLSVYLPHVALEAGWDRATLLEELAVKAELPRESWREARLLTFLSNTIKEA